MIMQHNKFFSNLNNKHFILSAADQLWVGSSWLGSAELSWDLGPDFGSGSGLFQVSSS